MAKVPIPTLNHPDPIINRQTGHLVDAINRVGGQTLDHWNDGTLFRKVLGVDHSNRVTASGLALHTILASNVASGTLLGQNFAPLTVSGALLTDQTVTLGKLAPCNQVSVYRTAAFNCGAGARSPLIADSVVKDVGGGYSQANGLYTIPSGGDWQFSWSIGLNTMANSGKEMFSALVINSGEVFGNVSWSSGASQYVSSVGTYMHCNALAGDKVAVRVFNGDTATAAMAVGSGLNFFTGYQVR